MLTPEPSIKNKPFSIQKKLVIYFLAISIIPLLAMGIFSLKVSTQPLKQYAIAPLQNHLLSITNHIKQELYSVREDALYTSRLPNLSRMLEYINNATIDEQLKLKQDTANDFIELLNKRKKYLYISYIDKSGKETLRINYLPPDKWEVVIGDKLQNKIDSDFFNKAINMPSGKVFFSEVTLNQEYGVLKTPYTKVIYASTPLKSISNENAGIVTIAYMASFLFKPIADWNVTKYPDAVCFIMNQKGFYIAHSDKNKEWGQRQQREMKWSILHDFNKDITEKLLNQQADSLTQTNDLILLKMSSYPEFVSSSDHWHIVTSVPKKSVFASIEKFKFILALILAAAIIATIILAMFLSSQFTKPIKILRNGAAIIKNGDLSHRISVESNDEIGELAYDFNLMAKELNELYKNLELKVKERTEQLQQAMEVLKAKDIELQKANELKLDFLTNLSKELRTPLTSVMGFVSLLSNGVYGDVTDKQLESFGKIKKNLHNTFKWLDGIIRISSLSSIQNDGFTARKTGFDAIESINSALHNLNYIIQDKEIKVITGFEKHTTCGIIADKEKFDEIISSILNGLIHYPSAKQVPLNINILNEESDELKIIFNMIFPKDVDIDNFYKALIEPFIHSASFFNITNLNTNVARSLLASLNGKLNVELNKTDNNLIIQIIIKRTGI